MTQLKIFCQEIWWTFSFFQKPKLMSFVAAQFSVVNYHLRRVDRSDKGGGVVACLRSDIAEKRQKDFEFAHTEAVSIEVNLNKVKWLICGEQKPPSMPDELFFNDYSLTKDKISAKYDSYIFLGDLNFDMLCNRKK